MIWAGPAVERVLVVVMIGTRSMIEMLACSLSSVIRVGLEIWWAMPPEDRARSTPLSWNGERTMLLEAEGDSETLSELPAVRPAASPHCAGRPKTLLRLRTTSIEAPVSPRLPDQSMPTRSATALLMRRILVSTTTWPLGRSMAVSRSRAISMWWTESMMMMVLVLGSKLTTPEPALRTGLISSLIWSMSVGRR